MQQLLTGVETAYLRNLTHAFALCDRHMRRIVGKWYRCVFCAKDLCTDCEEFDTHDSTHAFLVFKAPVDMQAFRCAFPDPCSSTWTLTDNVPTDTLQIWRTQLVVRQCCTETFTTHDMSNDYYTTSVSFSVCLLCDCSVCGSLLLCSRGL